MTPEQTAVFVVCTFSWGVAAHLRFRLTRAFHDTVDRNLPPEPRFIQLAHLHAALRFVCAGMLLYMIHVFDRDPQPRFAHLTLAFIVANVAWASLCKVAEQALQLRALYRAEENTRCVHRLRLSITVWCVPLAVCASAAALLVLHY